MMLLPQNTKLPKRSQNNGFKICELILVGILPVFGLSVTFYRWR